MNKFVNEKMVVFHDDSAVAVCKPDHLGFMGVYLKNIFLKYPVGTRLDVGFFAHETNEFDSKRVQMVVNKSDSTGTGLRLLSFEKDSIEKWRNLLLSVTNRLTTSDCQ